MTITAAPSTEQANAYLLAFDHFNAALFSGTLPRPMLTLSRQAPNRRGYFAPERWTAPDGSPIHEIGLNANALAVTPLHEMFAVLVHEMAHLAQHADPERYGKPGRGGYHSTDWHTLASSLGLLVEGSGQTVSTAPPEDGKGVFWDAYSAIPAEALLPYEAHQMDPDEPPTDPAPGTEPQAPAKKTVKKGSRVKYVCPVCGACAWGSRSLALLCSGHEGQPRPMVPTGEPDPAE